MNALRNRVQLIGHLGQEPEILTLDSGRKLAKFSIATNDFYYNKQGDKVEETEWHHVIAWGKTADVVEKYVNKGQEIAIDGKITSRSYDDKEGIKRYVTEIVCKELLMLSK